jgi:putative colanic acid biosynthesis acetyltransferase WcaF
MQLDIDANRKSEKWSRLEFAGRILWQLAYPFFAFSPRIFWGWRRWLLRLFGASIGRNVHIYPSTRIAVPWNLEIGDLSAVGDRAILYSLGHIRLGQQVTVSQYAHFCAGTHDHTKPDFPLVKAPITIGDGAWICADAFIGPNVTVGKFAIVGARAVVVKNVAEAAIVVGNPARPTGSRAV